MISRIPQFSAMPVEVLAPLASKYNTLRTSRATMEARHYSIVSHDGTFGESASANHVSLQAPARITCEETGAIETPFYGLTFDAENGIHLCTCDDYLGRIAPMNAALMAANRPGDLCQCKHALMLPILDAQASKERADARIMADLDARCTWLEAMPERLADALGLKLGGEVDEDTLIDTAAASAEAAQQLPAVEAAYTQTLARLERMTAELHAAQQEVKRQRENVRCAEEKARIAEGACAEIKAEYERRDWQTKVGYNALPRKGRDMFRAAAKAA